MAAENGAGEPPAPRRRDGDRAGLLSRAEMAADQIAALAARAEPGSRLGTKEELRGRCGVSVGTFNETLRLLQARGLVTVRPGPGGGLFAAEQTPMVRLGHSMLALDSQVSDVAEAARIRDALDPLLVEDALWHASPADIAELRARLADMRTAVRAEDPDAFIRANWKLHAAIAEISPNSLLRSLYVTLLDLIESHTLSVLPDGEMPLMPYMAERYELHAALVEALDTRDREESLRLVRLHNTTG
ncbi:FadR/GntR family transcriptional regulator [Nonomuraea sediminis]|uniref:FadR/GntR family transcriptional regulator n=1 Tax=Nonomuraea sediminis TaxID=2835864 RepID=UPI001BDC4F50|nr:FCD domain-containing protein [Nonomuraea sediminis]